MSERDKSVPSQEGADEEAIAEPVLAYTAAGNLEAHSVVTWLESNGVKAYAVEDNSGLSLFALGTISQVHKPQVFVSKNDLAEAGGLLKRFESQRADRNAGNGDESLIVSTCEECGVSSEFPRSQDGTTQNCPKCHAFMDVGTFDWPEDFDFGEEEEDAKTDLPLNLDDAIDAASQLDQSGDWDDALIAYQEIAEHWPEHAEYIANCIREVQRKINSIG